MVETRPVRRQARGERRIADILDAAAALFVELGYAATSTNKIAARAGMSSGSLYQFFPNKEAIAEALSQRLLTAMRTAHATAFDDAAEVATLPLAELLDRVVDPLVEFNLAHPVAKSLLAGPDLPAELAATRTLQEAVVNRVAAMIAARAPALPATDRDRAAMVAVQIVGAMMGPIVAAPEVERRALTAELKKALLGYLAPLAGG